MSFLKIALKGNIFNFFKKIKVISKKEKINFLYLFYKFIYCFLITRCGYSDFLNYKLYNKKLDELNKYVTIKHQDYFYEIVSPSKYKKTFTVKPNFLKKFNKYIQRDFVTIEDGLEKLNDFLIKNKTFIIKPIDGLGGQDVEKKNLKDYKNSQELFDYMKEKNMFVEEAVKQNDEINKLCNTSVNTIRIMTFAYNNKSEIIYAAMRVGNGINSVDNFHKNGMGISIDLKKGTLIGNAIDKDLNEFVVHPKSKVKFNGFKIPNWEYAKKMVLEASKIDKNIHVVGWDVAITNEGATFIEGNRRPGFDLIQVLEKKGRKDILLKILDTINKKEGKNYKL